MVPYDRNMPQKRMHQTTVRFGADLWEALEREGERLGVSVAQYVREAALARLIYAAGRRGDDEFDLALEIALGESVQPARLPQPEGPLASAVDVLSPVERAHIEASESAALWGQAQQARRRAAGVARSQRCPTPQEPLESPFVVWPGRTRQRFLASTARCSCRLFIRERPSMLRPLASL
jgi:hypothetical protein